MITSDGSGVTAYESFTAYIHFVDGHAACAYCPCLETERRNQCRLTGEYILDTRYTRGNWCPLVPVEKNEEKEE